MKQYTIGLLMLLSGVANAQAQYGGYTPPYYRGPAYDAGYIQPIQQGGLTFGQINTTYNGGFNAWYTAPGPTGQQFHYYHVSPTYNGWTFFGW